MASYTVRLLSPWCAHDGTNHPLFRDHYAVSWVDWGATPTPEIIPPNPVDEEIEAVVDDATLIVLQADARYTVVSAVPIAPQVLP